MKVANPRICSVCGSGFSEGLKFCPVCMLSIGVNGEASEVASQRFEHYEVLVSEDGRPIELGRGAMGVTYRAFDVDLQCPVTLKRLPGHLARKAEALHRANRASEALEAINEAETLAERFEQRYFCGELPRLRGVFLTALPGVDGVELQGGSGASLNSSLLL